MAFDVTAVLKANVSNFTSGIKEAQSVFESFQSKSNRTFEGISSGFQKAGTALTAGLTAPTIAGIGAVVKSYASLEQNLGGTQAVFGNFAKTVQNDAKDAYKNMGLSASDYMATANKMGSLFQGSGVEQQRSLDLTSKAMRRASDVASVMGVDLGMAMESIAGAAKGNFTMMDNLGVAMNATTLEAYALEKGLNFKWETASNAEKAELAMQMFMDRTKQYDGNFLKESEKNVAGSLDAMKGAFSNFVAGLGNPEADVAQLMTNLKTTIQNFAKNVGGVVKTIWDNLPLAPWQKWVGLIAVGAGPVLLAISGIMKGIGTLKAAFQGISAVLANPWGLALVGLVALVAGFVHAYQNSEKFRNIVNSVVDAVTTKFNELKAKAQPALDFIKNAFSKFNVGAFAPLIGGIGLFIASLMKLKGVKIPNPFSSLKPTPIKFPNPFSGLANMAKSAGSAVKSAFTGLGQSIATVFKGIGAGIGNAFRGLAMVNPVTMLTFAAAVLAVGAAITMVLTQSQGITALFNGIATVVTSVGGVITNFATSVIGAFASGIVTISGIIPNLAAGFNAMAPAIMAAGMAITLVITAFSRMAPVITALGTAISSVVSALGVALTQIISALGPAISQIVLALGTAISQIVTAIAGGISQIVTALTPIVQIVGTTITQVVTVISQAAVQIVQALAPIIPSVTQMFTTIATVVSSAIVQIVQALAPFIPSIAQIVTAVSSVLSQIVSALNNLISQISPIIDSITQLFQTLGEQISSILESAGGVIESFGSAIRTVLDGISGIFDSIGTAALNAGKGFSQLANGISKVTSLNIIDMGASLAAVAAGLTAIVASGIGSAGPGLQAAGMGMQLMGTSAQMASVAIQLLPTAFATLSASLGTLPAMMTMAGTAMTAFATSAQSSVSSLMAIGATITQFASMMTMIAPASATASAGLSSFNSQANAAGNAMQRLGSASSSALGQVTALGSGIVSSMAGATAAISSAGMQMANAVRMAGTQMVTATQASMNQIKSVVLNGMTASASAVRNGGSQMTTAFRQAGTQMVTITQSSMNQIKSAIQNGMSSVVSSVRNGGSQMVSAWQSSGQQLVSTTQSFVSSANSSLSQIGAGVNLYANGSALMAGLKSGIDAGWSAITASVSSMAAWIKKNKGPVSYDKKLLIENGLAIMSGLFRGISTGWNKVKGLVAPMAGKISDFVQGGMADSFALPDVATVLGSSLTISHTPQSVQHNINNSSNQQRLIDKIDELLEETRKGRVIYMDGKEVGRTVDRHLGQNTQLRSRTSWA